MFRDEAGQWVQHNHLQSTTFVKMYSPISVQHIEMKVKDANGKSKDVDHYYFVNHKNKIQLIFP